jgi:hypothetical protein
MPIPWLLSSSYDEKWSSFVGLMGGAFPGRVIRKRLGICVGVLRRWAMRYRWIPSGIAFGM